MSRSFKKAFVTISRRMSDNVHSIMRHRIRTRLAKMDYDEPDEISLLDIDADVKEAGLEDWGTKFGLEFHEDDYWQENKVKMQRK